MKTIQSDLLALQLHMSRITGKAPEECKASYDLTEEGVFRFCAYVYHSTALVAFGDTVAETVEKFARQWEIHDPIKQLKEKADELGFSLVPNPEEK